MVQMPATVREVRAPANPVSSAHGRLDWLDGLRAYAILAVISFHCFFAFEWHKPTPASECFIMLTQTGQYGVQLFFVISTLTVYQTLGRFPFSAATLRGWLVKRYLRIAPLFYVMIPAYFVVNIAVDLLRAHVGRSPLGNFGWVQALQSVFFLQGWVRLTQNQVIPGAWSIGVEMTFYLLAPVLFWVFRRGRLAYAVFPLIALACLALTRKVSAGVIPNNDYFYFWFPTQLPVFLAGLMLLKLTSGWLLTGEPAPKLAGPIAWTLGAPMLVLGCWIGVGGNINHGLAPAVLGVAFACLMVLARGPLRSLCSNAPAVWLGRISYSIYIVHFIVIFVLHDLDALLHINRRLPVVAAWLLSVSLTVAGAALIATVTRRWIEEPGIHLGRRLARLAAGEGPPRQGVVT